MTSLTVRYLPVTLIIWQTGKRELRIRIRIFLNIRIRIRIKILNDVPNPGSSSRNVEILSKARLKYPIICPKIPSQLTNSVIFEHLPNTIFLSQVLNLDLAKDFNPELDADKSNKQHTDPYLYQNAPDFCEVGCDTVPLML